MLSAVMEDYLKAIYVLEEGDAERVSTSRIAEYLGVTPPTVTSMIDKLEDRELIDREKYHGTRLTEEGRVVALEVIRHHRLIESFLADRLDYDWSEVHDEADRLEHHVSERFVGAVAKALDDPGLDPHGDPIPDADLELPEDVSTIALDTVSVGEQVVVRRLRHREDEELGYLAAAGIRPGAALEVVDIAPFGMVTVAGTNGRQSLPEEVAEQIEVAPASEVTPA